jgi:hypothetical protein
LFVGDNRGGPGAGGEPATAASIPRDAARSDPARGLFVHADGAVSTDAP